MASAADDWKAPDGHPISIERAKELMAGDLGRVYRSILSSSCVPIFWRRVTEPGEPILHNGTLTIVRTPKRLFGITAAHVLRQYERDHTNAPVLLQLLNARLEAPEIIDISEKLDLATIAITESLLKQTGKAVVPLSTWPPRVPQEGRGIMLGGYPGIDRLQPKPREAIFGMFTALGLARRVVGPQITWLVERDFGTGDLPLNRDLGGISGGPLIGLFESPSHLTYYALCGIISEAHPLLENVIARRADFIAADGAIDEPLRDLAL
jgi:hypothetical protein